MTDQELIKALRYCYDGEGCKGCLHHGDNENCMNVNPITAADRLEALLAENERLKAQVPKWVSVKERLPTMHVETYDDIDGAHQLCQSDLVLGVDIYGDVAIVWHNRTDYGKSYWEDEPGNYYEITHWMPLPSTEGVE